ncbi:ParA family protein [Aquabacterium soli]|uniref:ParA family protein n=1 Tax=Aquabacterium soli TaxID=2493092 RepID=A0A426V2S6_9BURK|nr:ParA family protein [Aquabacterium soli]RRS01156.1 ParA family protein [Aquabacterium soli]
MAKPKALLFAIQKGGQGKSMLSTHTAFLAAERGKKVLAADLDGQGTFSRNLVPDEFDRDTAPSLSLFTGTQRAPMPISLPYRTDGTISLMSGDRRLVQVDENPKIAVETLRTRLDKCAAGADLVVLDPPPTLGKRLRAALIAADFVVMPFVPARESVDGLGDLMDTIEEVKQEYNPNLKVIGLLANMVNSRSGFDRRILDDLQAAAPDMLLPMMIHDRTSISGAMASSRPVWQGSQGESQKKAGAEVRQALNHILDTVFKN